MKTTILIAILCAIPLASTQAGTIGVDPTGGIIAGVSGYGGLTLGYEFQVTDTNGIVIDGLGFWDNQSDGFWLSQTFPVGVWDVPTGTLLRSSVITSFSSLITSLHPDGDWRVNAVPPVFLPPGLYRIGALMPVEGANDIVDSLDGLQIGTGISFVRFLRQIGSATLAMPVIPLNSPSDACFGPGFTYIPGPWVAPPLAVVAPSAYTTVAGTSGLNTLVRNSGLSRTYQMQFTPAALGGLPVGARITELRFRADTNSAAGFPTNTVTWSDYGIVLAQASRPIGSMNAIFAANMLSPVIVKTGPLSIGTNTLAVGDNPNPFGSFVVFDTPYVYQGGDLVIFFTHSGSDSTKSIYLDAVTTNTPGYGTDFRALSANSYGANSGTAASATIVEIVFTPSISQTVARAGTNVVVSGTGGLSNATYRILISTNLASPMSQWTPVATNAFDGSGSFRYTNVIKANQPAQFFRTALP
jgi:hypothetical protein